MPSAGGDVRSVDAVLAEQQRRHARDRRRSDDVQIRDAAGARVPPLQHQPRVVDAVVVVQVKNASVTSTALRPASSNR